MNTPFYTLFTPIEQPNKKSGNKNREIDAIVQLEDGRWGAFEIKLGADAVDDAARSLIKIKDALEAEGAKTPDVLAVLCGLSNFAYRREDGVYVVPITALKP